MRILCTTFGSSGDVFPMLGLALRLRERGHDVVFATNAYYERMAVEHGLPFEPLGTEEQVREFIQHPDLWHPRRSFAFLFNVLRKPMQEQFELCERLQRQGPLVAVANCLSFGASMAAEHFRFPWITLHVQPAVVWSDVQPPRLGGLFGPRWLRNRLMRLAELLYVDPVAHRVLNPWRTQLGLPKIGRLTRSWHSRDGVLCMFPEWFAPPQPDWPQPLEQTDFPLWNFRAEATLEPDVAAFLDRGDPPIVFTPGTANIQGKVFFAEAVDACKRTGRRGLLLTEFEEHLPTALPSTVARFPYVPLDRALPRCSAIVHHGGIGTSSQGMLAGIPQLIMPMAHDQFDNADRLTRLGIGTSISVSAFRGDRIAGKLSALLSDPQVARNCKTIAKRLEARDGLHRSAIAVERLAGIRS